MSRPRTTTPRTSTLLRNALGVAALALATTACEDNKSLTSPGADAASMKMTPATKGVSGLAATVRTDTLAIGDTARFSAPPASKGPKGPVTWASSDPRVATVTNDGLARAVAAGTATLRVARRGVVVDSVFLVVPAPAAPAPTPVPTPTPTPTPVGASGSPTQAAVLAFMAASNVPSVATVRAQGGAFSKFEDDFASGADYQWGVDSVSFSANYYDRAMIYYVAWARTGNATYLDRANKLAVDARTTMASWNYNPQAYNMMLDGVALHALVTGDADSKTAVARIADNMANGYWFWVAGNPGDGDGDSRTSARVLGAILDAKLLGVQSPAGYDYAAKLRELMPRVLSTQSADGAYRWPNQCNQTKPFMTGMVNESLIRYYTSFEADSRILPAVKKAVDYEWANDWVASAAAFKYIGADCSTSSGGGAGPAADLNNLLTTGFQFVARQTGDASYQAKADAIFAGGVNGVWLGGQKQFNQEYTASYRYLSMRF